MGLRHALAAGVLALGAACGGKLADDDLTPTDAGKTDGAHDGGKKDSGPSFPDAAPYQPVGKACPPIDAGAPPPWTPDDAGAAVHPPLMHAAGGPVLANPIFVPVTFDGDPLRGPIDDFVASVGCTSYWRSVVPDYGVGDAYVAAPVHLSTTPPPAIDDTGFGAYIEQLLSLKVLPAPIDGRTLYVFVFPEATQLGLQGQPGCQSFLGYHDEAQLSDGHVVSYAALPRCSPIGQLDDAETLTAVTSHELMEAVTDPRPFSNPAYFYPEEDGIAWALGSGGEVGDLCAFDYGAYDYQSAFFEPNDYPFWVQRQWSQKSAFFGHDPCQPSSQTVFFGAAPATTDSIDYDLGWAKGTTTGVKLAVGQQKTIAVKLVADAPDTDTIDVQAFDGSVFGDNASLDLQLTPTQGKVGDTLQLTIKRTSSSAWYPLEAFALVATANGVSRTWWGVVGDP